MDNLMLIKEVIEAILKIFDIANKEGYLEQCRTAFDEIDGKDIVDEFDEVLSSNIPELSEKIEHFRQFYFITEE